MAKVRLADSAVAQVFDAYSPLKRERLLLLRACILQTAAETSGVGHIDETLRWQQPSFLTFETGSGSTIRIDAVCGNPKNYAIYFNCNTTLVEDFKQLNPKLFKFEGNRAIIFDVATPLPIDELRHCISLAQTYHQRKPAQTNRRK